MRAALRRTVAVGALTVAMAAGCNPHPFLIPAPNLRGITIPLPPPSFADEVLVTMDLSGTAPESEDSPGTRAFLYEKGTDRGYFVFVDDGAFTFSDVIVDIDDNCLETWLVDGDGDESTSAQYRVQLREGVEACESLSCSEQDEVGACLCLEPWTVGC